MEKNFLKLFIVLFCVLFLSSCATTGPKFSEMGTSISSLPKDMGRIFIYRTTILGTAIQPEVKLNGKPVGKAVPKGFFYIDAPPGSYTIETSTEVKRKLSFILEPGQIRYVRLNVSLGFLVGHVYPQLIPNETGEKEIQSCRFIGGNN